VNPRIVLLKRLIVEYPVSLIWQNGWKGGVVTFFNEINIERI
jgi:hypothetical protein